MDPYQQRLIDKAERHRKQVADSKLKNDSDPRLIISYSHERGRLEAEGKKEFCRIQKALGPPTFKLPPAPAPSFSGSRTTLGPHHQNASQKRRFLSIRMQIATNPH